MLLAIDIGNTNIVFGVMQGLEVLHTYRISSTDRTTDELGVLLLQLLNHQKIDPNDIDGAITSSVVPSQIYTIEKVCRVYLGVSLQIVGKGLKTGMPVRIDNPKEAGADRIVNSVAAIDRWGAPVIVVDFGTATTFDCVNDQGEYVGGAIAPGFKISEEALFEKTAKLPRVTIAKPQTAIGRSTVSAMQSGLLFGYVGLVDGLAERIKAELGPGVKVVATGGLANLIAAESMVIDHVDPYLTLRGLALLYRRNEG